MYKRVRPARNWHSVWKGLALPRHGCAPALSPSASEASALPTRSTTAVMEATTLSPFGSQFLSWLGSMMLVWALGLIFGWMVSTPQLASLQRHPCLPAPGVAHCSDTLPLCRCPGPSGCSVG